MGKLKLNFIFYKDISGQRQMYSCFSFLGYNSFRQLTNCFKSEGHKSLCSLHSFQLEVYKNNILNVPIPVHRTHMNTGWYRRYVSWKLRLETEQQHWFSHVGESHTRNSQRDGRQRWW